MERGRVRCMFRGRSCQISTEPEPWLNAPDHLQTTYPKIIVESSYDKFWGTGIPLQDSNALDSDKWVGRGSLSDMLLTVRKELKTASNGS